MDLVQAAYRPLTRHAARRTLVGRVRSRQVPEQGRFTRADVDQLLALTWGTYRARKTQLPKQPTVGSTMNVRLACMTQSFFEALLARGIERLYAIELIADVAWMIYRGWARIALAVSYLEPRNRTALGFATTRRRGDAKEVILRFPFNAPGYRIRSLSTDDSGLQFDVLHCPVANYFRSQGASDLCLGTWCNLDYALADLCPQKLSRTATLAGGADRCDFRVRFR